MFSRNFKILIAALWLLFSFCKEPVLNDSELVPDNKLGVFVTDTLTLVTQTVREDSLRTDELAINIIGKMNDPVFGKSLAGAYFQLRLQTNSIDLGENLELDSAVLMLRYSGGYGDIKKPLTFIAYEITESMDKDALYYSNKSFTIGDEIGRLENHVPNLNDDISTVEGKLPPHLRIKLHQNWASRIFSEAEAGSGNVANNENFVQYMKGIYVTVDENAAGNSILYFDLLAATSAMAFYYKKPDEDSLAWKIVVNNSSATSNFFKHDYSGSVVEKYLSGKRNASDSLVFIQSMAGLKAKVNIPNLKNLGNISINKAELIITGLKTPIDITSEYAVPGRLTLNASDSIGKNDFLEDQFVSETYFGGIKGQEADGLGNSLNRYKFNTALYYQAIVQGSKQDYGIFILTFPSSRIADRLIAGGGNHSKNKMKLKLTYTKIE
jgi:hypothetical protein